MGKFALAYADLAERDHAALKAAVRNGEMTAIKESWIPRQTGLMSMHDPFLNYFALGLLFFVVIVLVYGIIAIHDIPARIFTSCRS